MNIQYLQFRIVLLSALKELCDTQIGIDFYTLVYNNTLKDYLSLSLDERTYFSYTKKPENVLDEKRRNRCSIGSYLYKYLGHKYCDALLDEYRNKIFNKLNLLSNAFNIVSGEDIVGAYKQVYASSSCMTEPTKYKYTEFYAKNDVQLLKYDDQFYKARALIFKTREGYTVIDRIYPNYGCHLQNIIDFAKKNGWLWREHQGSPHSSTRFTDGKDFYYCSIEMLKHDYYPYMDSFSYGIDNGDKFILHSDNMIEYTHMFTGTNGSYAIKCEECEEQYTYSIRNNMYMCNQCYNNFPQCRRCGNAIFNKTCGVCNG